MTENVVLEILRVIHTDISGLKTDIAGLRTDLSTVKTEVRSHTRVLDMLQQDTRLIRPAVNDIARVDVTSGEVEALHHDVHRVQREIALLAERVEAIEERDRQ